MSTLPIQFFQVGAAAIPTLLVAVSLTLKMGASNAVAIQAANRVWKTGLILSTVLLPVLIIAGELNAVVPLLTGQPNRQQAVWVWVAISICIVALLLELVMPVCAVISKATQIILLGIIVAAFLASLITVFVVLA
ncbi:hypothetical protein [Cryobacterium sp. MDB2-33-2]|uniref:hypothetical protein n=1 Tax=Cryobacterium sp. MDB2-33-2 TaxID=1259179 RepID=UPI00106B6163|nr:hypothetical protein [Cryobacterium sp. MDB2-33-2]TFC03362.1 hypothetical protein E3O59_15900 [Cryobacterium sp. MDB2-33-2]